MPPHGIVWFNYYSGEGKGFRGCKPNVPFRKSLLNLVLADEKDLVSEENRFKPLKNRLAGEVSFHRNQSKFIFNCSLKFLNCACFSYRFMGNVSYPNFEVI